MVAETTEKRREVKDSQEKTEILEGRGCYTKRREVLNEERSVLSEESLAERPSFFEERCGGSGVVREDLYSLFTF